jgi:hypothetical protein
MFEDSIEKVQTPGRLTRNTGHIGIDCLHDGLGDLLFPVFHIGNLIGRSPDEFREFGLIFLENSCQIPDILFLGIGIFFHDPANHHKFSLSDFALGIAFVIPIEDIKTSLDMSIFECFFGDGDVFFAASGCP